jgi:hypothetical protein
MPSENSGAWPTPRDHTPLVARNAERITTPPPSDFDPKAFARRVEEENRLSQLPTTPAINLDSCRAALREAPLPTPHSGFRIARAPSAPAFVSGDDAPYLLVSRADLEWFDLDDETAKVLLRIDGVKTVDELAAATDVSFERVAVILTWLANQAIVSVR